MLREPLDLATRRARVSLAAADADTSGARRAGATQLGEHVVGQVLAQCAEGGPFAADEAQHGPVELRAAFDAVIARDEAWSGVVVMGQGTDAREAVDDLRSVDLDRGEDVTDEV